MTETLKANRVAPETVDFTDREPLDAWANYRDSGLSRMITSMHLCMALQAVHETGLLNRLRDGIDVTDRRSLERMHAPMVRELLQYLAVHGVVAEAGGRYTLTPLGRRFADDVALAQLGFYVEAYGPVLHRLPQLLSGEARYGQDLLRDGEALGRHCSVLGRVFFAAMIKDSLRRHRSRRVLDLGCGSGGLLLDRCREHPDTCGVGIDLSGAAVEYARRMAAVTDAGGRLQFHVRDAFRPDTWPDAAREPDAITAIGILHELFRDGDDAMVELLNAFAARLRPRQGVLVLLEPEIRYETQENDSDFFLIHLATEQGMPRRREGWLELFERTDFRCERVLSRPGAGPRCAVFELVPA